MSRGFSQPIYFSKIIKSASYGLKWIGIRWQFIFSVIVIWAASRWLQNEYSHDDSNLWLVMREFLLLAQWTIFGLFTFSLITTFSVWIYFIVAVKNNANLHVKFGDGQKAEAGWVSVSVRLTGATLRPLLGTIQARLIFAHHHISDAIIIDSNLAKPRHLWRETIAGTGQILLHDRGIYDVQQVLFSFCDMFGLISLPVSIPFTQQLYTLPLALESQPLKLNPHSTEDQTYRIDVPKRVEGEFINYKEYETGDNIHRIVWKIYAKSGELVVRIPEIKDPYASHLYFYVSFFYGLNLKEGVFEKELLNVYKDRVRYWLEALQRNEFQVRLPHDQEIPKLFGVGDKKTELFQITASSWQNKTTPTAFVNYSKAAFVCVSSLTPVDEIETLLRNLPAAVPLVIIKLSTAIVSPFQISMKTIFFRPEKKPTDHLRQPWLISKTRKILIENERAISTVIKQRSNTWLTDSIELER